MKIALMLSLLLAFTAGAVTLDNDAGCDISVLPAATLLLPYFEVDLDRPGAETTLFTVTNVTNVDQIARLTLWTDYSYPVISFNIYLTGYDVQAINLFDVIGRGVIAPDAGTGTAVARRGRYSDPNPALDVQFCDRLPGPLDDLYVDRMQDAFTDGTVPRDYLTGSPACEAIGGVHARAVGYVTIDVVRRCDITMPTDAAYWSDDIGYDNVLTGDYQQINGADRTAYGNPMVHIRAVPEGGTPESRKIVRLPRTFYGRYQPATNPQGDGRQPLPSTFAARWTSGETQGETSLRIWREAPAAASCADYAEELGSVELVLFDEDENAVSRREVALPATSRTSIADGDLYPSVEGATSGWVYLNLDATRGDGVATQNWVTAVTTAPGRFATSTDAVALGNGCSPAARTSAFGFAGGPAIAPAPDGKPSEPFTNANDDSCDISLLPAATLLLPYFEVNLDEPAGENTVFSVTNVGPDPQIARVTLWTDYGFPVIGLNVLLDAYDSRVLDLADVLARGVVGPAGGRRSGCEATENLTPELLTFIRSAFMNGDAPDGFGPYGERCNAIGGSHDNAVGYATIDVVRACTSTGPSSPQYWSADLGYANVLIGDYQQIDAGRIRAQGAPLVHIRAIPEQDGGDDVLETTFYRRHQTRRAPGRDRRQPLPSAFAARWIQGGVSEYRTSLRVWREGSLTTGSCSRYPDGGVLPIAEVVRFDDAENAVAGIPVSRTIPIAMDVALPLTSSNSVTRSDVFPQLTNGAVSGWMYVNLDDVCTEPRDCFVYGPDPSGPFGGQAWVVTSMSAAESFSVAMDAAAMGNGCSAPFGETEASDPALGVIGPAPNRNRR